MNWDYAREIIGMKSLMCPHCSHYLSTKYNLRKHVEATHLQLKPFVCGCCPKAFSYKHSFVNHMKMHMKEEKQVEVMDQALKNIAGMLDEKVAKKPAEIEAVTSEVKDDIVLPKLKSA